MLMYSHKQLTDIRFDLSIKMFYSLVVYSPEQCHCIICAFTELFDILIPHWCTQLAHGRDYIRSKPLDVYSIVVSLLTNQVQVHHLHDLGPHPIGTGIEE